MSVPLSGVTEEMVGAPTPALCPYTVIPHESRTPSLPVTSSVTRSVQVPAALSPRCRAEPKRKPPANGYFGVES